jgi:hypothetical protein
LILKRGLFDRHLRQGALEEVAKPLAFVGAESCEQLILELVQRRVADGDAFGALRRDLDNVPPPVRGVTDASSF